MKKIILTCLIALSLEVPMAFACTPTILYGRATEISDVMVAMLKDTTIPAGAMISKIDFNEGFIVVHTTQGSNEMCYTYAAGFNGNCSAHGATLWDSGPCPEPAPAD
jgi:hypothetical protein